MKPRRNDLEILKAILKAAKKFREPYSISELARNAGVTRKTTRRWLKILGVVDQARVLPLEVKRSYYLVPFLG